MGRVKSLNEVGSLSESADTSYYLEDEAGLIFGWDNPLHGPFCRRSVGKAFGVAMAQWRPFLEVEMMERITEASPRFQARMAGVFAWIGTTEGFAIWVRSRLVVDSDAAATADNILAHELLYRWGFVGDVISCFAFIIYTLLLYNLFRPVSRRLSSLAAVSNLVGEAIQLSIGVFLLAPLAILEGAHSLSAVNVAQSQALALMFLNFYNDGYAVSMVLFGFWNILTGYLIFRSTFLPRILGVLLAISGLCYQIDSFAGFLWPAFQAHLEPYILLPGVAELLLALWLVVMGVNEQRWKEQAAAAGVRT